MRRSETYTAHRELFRAATIDETVALACTCRRGVDHWYGEPMRASDHLLNDDPALAAPAAEAATSGETAGASAIVSALSRSLRRSPGRAAQAS
jgi:hypothetical protein